MKRVTLFLSVAGLCALLATGTNPYGQESPQDGQDLQGIQGVRDDDGNTIYCGTAVPPIDLGNTGDFYLHTSSSNLYGPKTAGGWGIPVSLRDTTGATGAAGMPGADILNGMAETVANRGAVSGYLFFTTR